MVFDAGGFAVCFCCVSAVPTPLKVVTDGILLREMQSDFLLTKYRHVSLSSRV
jgi:HrpA-like RNA helicase